jgi:hypothetical protein
MLNAVARFVRVSVLCVLGTACGRRVSTAQAVATESDAAPAAAAPVPATAVASPAADAAAAPEAGAGTKPCVAPALQPRACVVSGGPVKGKGFVPWFAERGVERPADLRRLEAIEVEGCEEAAFGASRPSHEKVLLCLAIEPEQVVTPLGPDGPTQLDTVLKVLTVRDRRLVELARLPIGLGSSEFGEPLFFARYELHAETGSLDLVVDKEDCQAASERLKAYWARTSAKHRGPEPGPSDKHVADAVERERRAGEARIAAICRAAGHYVEGPDGRFVRSKERR